MKIKGANKRKKYKSLMSMLAAGVLAFSVAGTAGAADWTTYQGNNDPNGLIIDGAPIAKPTERHQSKYKEITVVL